MTLPADYPVSKNFSRNELACKKGLCPHCGGLMHCEEFAIERLQALRDALGVPLTINSAFRCPAHNAEVGGKPDSQHLAGIAFDVALSEEVSRRTLIAQAKLLGFHGIGQYDSFVHLDLRPTTAAWDYRKGTEA